MINVYDKIKGRSITFPASPPEGGVYTPVREFGTDLLYCSGCDPDLSGSTIIGKLGRDLAVEEGQKAAYNRALNLLANTEAKIDDLNKIKRFAKVLASVNGTDDFTQQPQIVNGAFDPLAELFGGEIGCPVRSAIRANALPGGIACEIEVLLEVEA